MSSIISGFIVFSLIITSAFFVGLLTFLKDHVPKQCEMTYMYQYPQYVRISQKIDEIYPQYALFAYSEGQFTEASRNMHFTGIPILFIPGNAGSYRQARSIASVALVKAYNSRTPFHFDHFLLNLNKEYSGLNGGLLSDHLAYANHSLFRILELYKDRKNPPKSIILYGHSVGGIIAQRLVESLPEGSTLVPIVLTLATPHKRPPLMLDSYIYDFYKSLNTSRALNTTFISISGGFNDFLVPSYLTNIQTENSLSVVATHIPRSWTPCDHVGITWCKQNVLVINRALFDSVDPKTKQISTNSNFRKNVFYHHFIHHNGLNPFLRDHYDSSSANIRNSGQWIEYLTRQAIIKVPKNAGSPYFYMLRLLDQPLHEAVTIVALNLETIDWAFVCGAHIPRDKIRVCEDFTHLSHKSEIAPSKFFKRRSLILNLHDLIKKNPDWSHVVLRALPSDEDVSFHFDIYRISDRNLTIDLPHILSFKRQIIVNETPEMAVHFQLVLPTLTHVIQAYQLFVEELHCSAEKRHATATLIVPWAYQNQQKYFIYNDSGPMTLRLYSSKLQSSESAKIQLALDPNCRYKISIRSYIPGKLSQLVRFYSPFLVANVATVILMTLNAQLKSLENDRKCSLFFVALSEGAKPYYVLTTVKLISRFLSNKQILNLPPPDWSIMSEEGTDFFLLPLLLYLCSVGIVWILGIILSASLIVCETTVNKWVLKFLGKTIRFSISWSDYIMSALHKLPFIVGLVLISLCFTTTGSLALCVGTVFYFLRLTQLSQDFIEEFVWYYVTKFIQIFKKRQASNNNNNNNEKTEMVSYDSIFFHITLFFIWCIITALNVPSVLTWAHNFKYNRNLQSDPSFIPGLLLSLCAVPLWQLEIPKIERKGYYILAHFMSLLAVVSLIYAPISIFRLNYILTVAVVAVTLHQLVGLNRDLTSQASRTPNWFETMKAKLE